MPERSHPQARTEGARERKRRETLARIVDAGVRLFVAQGYDATTITQIAEAAGISRRTFFHYLGSKDDVLLSLQSGAGALLADAVRAAPPDADPLAAIRSAMTMALAALPTQDMIAIDRLMRANPQVQARKQASYVRQEEELFAALRERWPQDDRAIGLRLVAVLALGAMRLSIETFTREGGHRPLAAILETSFDAIEAELVPGGRAPAT